MFKNKNRSNYLKKKPKLSYSITIYIFYYSLDRVKYKKNTIFSLNFHTNLVSKSHNYNIFYKDIIL